VDLGLARAARCVNLGLCATVGPEGPAERMDEDMDAESAEERMERM
jgi:hypothetical protein